MTINELEFKEGVYCEHCGTLKAGSLIHPDNGTSWCIECWDTMADPQLTKPQLKFLRKEQKSRRIVHIRCELKALEALADD